MPIYEARFIPGHGPTRHSYATSNAFCVVDEWGRTWGCVAATGPNDDQARHIAEGMAARKEAVEIAWRKECGY